MVKIIAIGGEPGAGKTTFMREIIKRTNVEPKYNEYKLVPYLQKDNIYILGKYEEGTFQGTDRMSMAVQPAAVSFLDTLPENSVVLYEGDRLFNNSFLEHCDNKFDLRIIYLKTSKEVRVQRCKDRGSEQNDTWLAGRETKVNNILSNLTFFLKIQSLPNNTIEEQENNIKVVMDLV
jgi:dephospho-CoA kinase